MEIRFIEFFLTLNKNSITLSIDDKFYTMVYVNDEQFKRIFTQFFFHVFYSLHD